jgi:hypothetical protein
VGGPKSERAFTLTKTFVQANSQTESGLPFEWENRVTLGACPLGGVMQKLDEVLELPQDSFRAPSPRSADSIAETVHKPRIRCQAQSRTIVGNVGCRSLSDGVLFQ